jgi:hypothetical protein
VAQLKVVYSISTKSIVKIKIEPWGIVPTAEQPYPKVGGKYKVIDPPFLISGIPNCQPFIN